MDDLGTQEPITPPLAGSTAAASLPLPAQHSPALARPGVNRGGAPAGNRNNLRHGLRAGRMPPGCSWIAAATAELRTALEAAVLAQRGAVSITDAAWINTAVRAERHAMLCDKLLRDDWDKLDTKGREQLSREVDLASERRTKSIEKLKLAAVDGESDPGAAIKRGHDLAHLEAAASNVPDNPQPQGL